MLKTISSSELRTQIKQVLNEVGYGQAQYVVKKFGEPTAAIVNMDDFHFLQASKKRQAAASLREVIADVRSRSEGLEGDELDALVEEARAEFYHRQAG